MRKDDPITAMEVDGDGNIIKYPSSNIPMDIAPLAYRKESNWLKRWWQDRCVPKTREGVVLTLLEANDLTPSKYLLNNLGLSLTDYYWIKPIGSQIKWKDVNLYDNDFSENLFLNIKSSDISKNKLSHSPNLSPNSSLKGDLEKTWKIEHGNRTLFKGNFDGSSEESINEVIATLLHTKQGYDNFTEYKLAKVPDRDYDYGCCCKAFTNQSQELVSAWEIITSEKMRNDESYYEFFIRICSKYGADEMQLRKDLEYQIMSDYILTNRDRHLNNIGIIRNAETLKFIRMAPIYDSGKCMFVGKEIPKTAMEIQNNNVNSFCNTEFKLLNLVTDKSLLDVSKLPTDEELFRLYKNDSKLSEERIELILKAYNIKVEYFKNWQLRIEPKER